MLKLNGGKGFFFPRRQRFNEDLKSETQSIREQEVQKVQEKKSDIGKALS